jgi:hypothetical protein
LTEVMRYQVEPDAVRPLQVVRHEPPVTLVTATTVAPADRRALAVEVVLGRVRSVTPLQAVASVDDASARAGSKAWTVETASMTATSSASCGRDGRRTWTGT